MTGEIEEETVAREERRAERAGERTDRSREPAETDRTLKRIVIEGRAGRFCNTPALAAGRGTVDLCSKGQGAVTQPRGRRVSQDQKK